MFHAREHFEHITRCYFDHQCFLMIRGRTKIKMINYISYWWVICDCPDDTLNDDEVCTICCHGLFALRMVWIYHLVNIALVCSKSPGVAAIEDCREACQEEPQCAFLTYFAANRCCGWVKIADLSRVLVHFNQLLHFWCPVFPSLRLASYSLLVMRFWNALNVSLSPTLVR